MGISSILNLFDNRLTIGCNYFHFTIEQLNYICCFYQYFFLFAIFLIVINFELFNTSVAIGYCLKESGALPLFHWFIFWGIFVLAL